MPVNSKLNKIRDFGGRQTTPGLADDVISQFVLTDNLLIEAIDEAYACFCQLIKTHPQIMSLDEDEQIKAIQSGIVNFYSENMLNPYVAIAARGPWVITSKGAVIHDNGGYGMLGFGHAPAQVLQVMAKPQVMANVMTASFSQQKIIKALKHEVGHSIASCPYSGFLFLNSGSEAVSAGARISDINAKLATDKAAVHDGKKIKHVALKGGFHGRTDRPAQYSDSTRPTYRKYLASFRDQDHLLIVEPNNLQQIRHVFSRAEADGVFIESMFIEPVMGEGNPGLALSREFYDLARKLTRRHGSLLLVDSIQAGIRAQGCLSIVDYPGFEGIQIPDLETWSKALNAGQFPLSVLAMSDKAASLYQKGVYGNTMTANPRALDVATQVLAMITPELRENIRQKGVEFKSRLGQIGEQLDGAITNVQGTGLLVSCELHPDIKSYGENSIEEILRKQGIGVIHGGKNSLRFTPHFNITSNEIDLIIRNIKQTLFKYHKSQ